VLNDLLSRWPLIQQIHTGADGTGPESMSERTRNLQPKHHGAEVTRSICPYCGVGCGQLELHTHPGRLKRVKYRRPHSRRWEQLYLETAMDMIADRVWESRERTFQETRDGEPLMQTTAIAHLGGATLDNEENYLIKKLFTAGLGMVCLSNQARI